MALGSLKAVKVVAVADLFVIRMSFMTEIASYVLAGLESLQERRLRVSLKIYDISRYGKRIQNGKGENLRLRTSHFAGTQP